MPNVISNYTAEITLRYWAASLAWRRGGDYARGWTTGGFIDECKILCHAQTRVGDLADCLLADMVEGVERRPNSFPAEVIELHSKKPIIMGQVIPLQPKEANYA